MRAAPRRSSSSRRLSAFSSRRRRLSRRLAARLATAVTRRRCSSSKGVGSAGPSRATQPAMRSGCGRAPLNQSGAQSTDRTLPSSAATRGARNAPWVRSTRSATAGSIGHGRRALDRSRGGHAAREGGSPSKRATRPRRAGTASSRWPSSVSRSTSARRGGHHRRRGAGQHAEDPALARQGPRLEVRARGEIGDVAQPRPGRDQRGVGGRLGVVEDERPSRTSRSGPRRGAAARAATRTPFRRVPLRLPRSRRTQPRRPAHDLRVAAREQHVGQDEVAVVRAAEHDAVGAQGEDLARPVPRRQSQVRHALPPLPTRRSRSPRRGGSTRPTSSRARGRRRWR